VTVFGTILPPTVNLSAVVTVSAFVAATVESPLIATAPVPVENVPEDPD
jgi:hypothetical protein